MKAEITSPKAKTRKGSKLPLRAVRTILAPVDFSDPSSEALRTAVMLAKANDAKLALLHVIEPMPVPDLSMPTPILIDPTATERAATERLRKEANACGLPPKLLRTPIVRCGRAFKEIVLAAADLRADLIVISTHGYTGIKHVIMGSTAERVVREAPCPVLVLRARED